MGGSAMALLAALAGVAAVLALRELAYSVPIIYRTAERTLDPLTRLGREGRPPTDLERRNLGGLVGLVLGGSTAIVFGLGPATIAAVSGPALAAWLIGRRTSGYRERIEAEVPALANALADALKAGSPIRRAVTEASVGLEGPIGAELARVCVDLDLGLPLRAALEDFAIRTGSTAVDGLVRAVGSQERTGGDLVALLRRHADAAEERRRSEADARAATSQARMTAGMVVAMPVGAAALVELGSPGFISGVASQPLALALVAAAAVLQVLGYLVIRRIGEVRG